jgi:hypothetical protein
LSFADFSRVLVVAYEIGGIFLLSLHERFGFVFVKFNSKQFNTGWVSCSASLKYAGSIKFSQMIAKPMFRVDFALYRAGYINDIEKERKGRSQFQMRQADEGRAVDDSDASHLILR